MGLFKAREIASSQSGLDDACFVADEPVTAHQIRTMIRSVNRACLIPACVHRWLGIGDTGSAVNSVAVPPYWSSCTAQWQVPILYAPGISQIRTRIRVCIESGYDGVEFGATTSVQDMGRLQDTKVLLAPSGLTTPITVDLTTAVSPSGEDVLTFWWRAKLNGTEALMSVPTYYGENTGTVTRGFLGKDTLAFNTPGSTPWVLVHRGGHYIRFLQSTYQVHVAEIRDTSAMHPGEVVAGSSGSRIHFWPPMEEGVVKALTGATYEIRRLPQARLLSIASYEVRS